MCSSMNRSCEQSVYVVCVQVGLLNKLLLLWWRVTVMVTCHCYGDVLLLWWCVTLMVMCYCYGDVLLLWWCVTLMVTCYSYGDVLLLWWHVTVMVTCYCYGDVLLLWWHVTVMVTCYCYGDVLLLWWCVTVMVMCYLHPYQTSTRTGATLSIQICDGLSDAYNCVWSDNIMQKQNICHLSSCGMKSTRTGIHNS